MGVYRNKPGSKGEFIQVNPALVDILEAESKEELLKYTASDFYIDESQRKKLSEKLEKKGKIENKELRQKTLRDKEIWVAVTAMKSQDDSEVFYDGILRDITEKKKQEEKLKETKERLEEAQRVAGIGHWTWDIETDNLEWSDQVYRIFGLDPEEFNPTYLKFLEYVHPEDREKVRKNVEEPLQKNNYNMTYRIVRPDEKIRIVQETGEIYFKDSEPKRMLGTIQDVTKEERRKRKLQIFRHAVDQAGSAIYIVDKDGEITYVNPKFTEITGYTKDEALGKNPSILKSGEQPQEYYSDLWDTILSGETWEEQILNKRKDGGLYYADQTIAPINQNGEITHFVAIQRDVTTERLEKQQTQVLYRVLRHNLRNKLNFILLKIKEIEKNTEKEKFREQIKEAEEAIKDLEKLSEKTQKAKEIFEIEGSEILERDIKNILEEIKKELLEKYPNAGIDIDIDIEEYISLYVSVKPALYELIENAIKHNDSETPKADISVWETNDNIKIEIQDNGVGMPESEKEVLEIGKETPLKHSAGLGL